jgi:hypothetical protein
VSLNRHAVRRDANEREIIDGLENEWWIFQLDKPCDLLCIHRKTKRRGLLEIKPPKNPRWQPGQRELCESLGIPVVRTLMEAIAALEAA